MNKLNNALENDRTDEQFMNSFETENSFEIFDFYLNTYIEVMFMNEHT